MVRFLVTAKSAKAPYLISYYQRNQLTLCPDVLNEEAVSLHEPLPLMTSPPEFSWLWFDGWLEKLSALLCRTNKAMGNH